MCHSRQRAGAHHVSRTAHGRSAGHRHGRDEFVGHGRDRDEPVVAGPHHLRASDAERDRTVDALRAHAAAGRLDATELEQRLERALAAPTRGDLAALLADLPGTERPRAATVRHRGRVRDPLRFLPIAVLLVAIWALTGAGYFWPVWPLLGFAFATLMHSMPRTSRPRF